MSTPSVEELLASVVALGDAVAASGDCIRKHVEVDILNVPQRLVECLHAHTKVLDWCSGVRHILVSRGCESPEARALYQAGIEVCHNAFTKAKEEAKMQGDRN